MNPRIDFRDGRRDDVNLLGIVLVELVRDFAHDLFEDIFERNDADIDCTQKIVKNDFLSIVLYSFLRFNTQSINTDIQAQQ